MFLVRLIYASKISSKFEIDDVKDIVNKATKSNVQNNITGLLCFNRNYFLQCIEGERSVVNETFIRISGDPRHEHVTLLSYDEIVEREFTDWAMEYVPESQVSMALTRKFSASCIFNPFEMSGSSSHLFIRAIRGASQRDRAEVAKEDAQAPKPTETITPD